jgi:5-(carboxyamino)imidazole ribonucleotide synthase
MKTFLPGSTIGILGGGQLGRMSILAGRRLGYRFVVWEPQQNGPAEMVADATVHAPFDDLAAAEEFARQVDVVTLEFENIPSATVKAIAEHCPVHPGHDVLFTCQNREREKLFLRSNNFACAPFEVVHSADELKAAIEKLGTPCVLKTADFGYDGKGQIKISADMDPNSIWDAFDSPKAVLEKWITFSGEYSVICARNGHGECSTFPLAANDHRNHILHQSSVPSGLSAQREAEARELAMAITHRLNVIGLLAVELFLTERGWVVNELAPRPHNSGHYSLDACLTSQFEQHIRAIAGLPLGDPALLSPVSMVNILGNLWPSLREPDWQKLLKNPKVKLHLYGKAKARPGRKMGHFCVLDNDPAEAAKIANAHFQELVHG